MLLYEFTIFMTYLLKEPERILQGLVNDRTPKTWKCEEKNHENGTKSPRYEKCRDSSRDLLGRCRDLLEECRDSLEECRDLLENVETHRRNVETRWRNVETWSQTKPSEPNVNLL